MQGGVVLTVHSLKESLVPLAMKALSGAEGSKCGMGPVPKMRNGTRP